MSEVQEKYADKIAKLLRKAESTQSSEEAEALVAKAQALMTQYGIEAALLAKAQGKNLAEQEKIIKAEIKFTGIYHQALFDIGAAVSRNNDCKHLITKGGKSTTITIIGFESDVQRVEFLIMSLQVQCIAAQGRWWKANAKDYAWMSGMEKYKARREFVTGFALGLGDRLRAAREEGKQTAVAAAVQSGVTDAAETVALVIRAKDEQVSDWIDQKYGKLRYTKTRRARGAAGAGVAGREAGLNADVGNARLGARRALPGGN